MFRFIPALALAWFAACASDKTDADFRADVVEAMHDSIGTDLDRLVVAALELQAAAPIRAWNAVDADAIEDMRESWRRTRVAYEHVEGATAPLFGNLDVALDARYDDYLATLGADGDRNLFDATGVTGMHGVERILFAPTIRPEVVAFEVGLPGYQEARFPRTDDEAISFKTLLVQKLIDDASALHNQWQPAAIDIGAAYQGLVGLMNEQAEKVDLAATGQEESRYADLTLFDLHNNLEGTRKIYELLRDWIHARPEAEAPDATIQSGLAALRALYLSLPGGRLPPVPDDWSSDQPTEANLATPFGMLWKAVHDAVDPGASGSVVFEMNRIAVLLGFPESVEAERPRRPRRPRQPRSRARPAASRRAGSRRAR
jgi:iron uptake system component EfeO